MALRNHCFLIGWPLWGAHLLSHLLSLSLPQEQSREHTAEYLPVCFNYSVLCARSLSRRPMAADTDTLSAPGVVYHSSSAKSLLTTGTLCGEPCWTDSTDRAWLGAPAAFSGSPPSMPPCYHATKRFWTPFSGFSFFLFLGGPPEPLTALLSPGRDVPIDFVLSLGECRINTCATLLPFFLLSSLLPFSSLVVSFISGST